MSGVRKSDHPERRKIALMRRADTESGATHNIGGVKKRADRPKPSLPKMPWDGLDLDHRPKPHKEPNKAHTRRYGP